jgi:hypothetical protein
VFDADAEQDLQRQLDWFNQVYLPAHPQLLNLPPSSSGAQPHNWVRKSSNAFDSVGWGTARTPLNASQVNSWISREVVAAFKGIPGGWRGACTLGKAKLKPLRKPAPTYPLRILNLSPGSGMLPCCSLFTTFYILPHLFPLTVSWPARLK